MASKIDVAGIDHVYLTVSDLRASEAYYDRVMSVLGFAKVSGPLAGGDVHIHYFNDILQISLRPARTSSGHDPYSPGLHHLCLRVGDRSAVNGAAEELRALGVEVTEPAGYPQYHPDYYAIFFEDPDGIRLEVMNTVASEKTKRPTWREDHAIEL